MASTQYTTSVTFYREVPFDNSYNHTLGAASVADKKTFFDTYSHTDFSDLMTIKVDSTTSKGTIKLNVREDYAHTYNYAYISDSKTGNYFAFILGCRYINDGKVESGVQYSLYEFDIEVDVMTSFLTNDNQLFACPIDRHHASETNGFNRLRIAESVALGEYTYNEIENAPALVGTDYNDIDTHNYMILIAYLGNIEGTSTTRTEVHYIQGVPQGMHFEAVNYSLDSNYARTWLEDYLNDVDDVSQVLGIYVVPYAAFTAQAQALRVFEVTDDMINRSLKYWCVSRFSPSGIPGDTSYKLGDYSKLDGFTPHNKKLTYYPYNYGRLMNDMGNYTDIHFENWDNLTLNSVNYKAIGVETTAAPPVTFRAGPINYNGYRGFEYTEEGRNYYNRVDPDYKVELSNFPLGSWTCDAYQMYVAQNGKVFQNKMEYTAGKALFGAALGASSGNWAGAGDSLMSGVGSLIEQYQNWNNSLQQAKDAPDSFSGSSNISNLDFAYYRKQFRFAHISIRESFAKQIDKYFSRYGYSQAGYVGKPVTNSRPKFTYIKTLDECYNPSTTTRCSMSQQRKVNEIFMNGCTFWNISSATKSEICMFNTIYNNDSNGDIAGTNDGGDD